MRKILTMLIMVAFLFGAAGTTAAVQKITIAIMNFNITNMQQAEVELLIDFFNNALFETGIFDVVQRDKRDKLMQEIEFSLSDAADAKKTRELGKLLSVKLVLFGSVGKLGANVLFNLTMVDVDTGRTIGTFSKSYGGLEEIANELSKISTYAAEVASLAMFRKKTNVIYYDDFNQKSWITSEKLFYTDGKYNVYSKTDDWYVWETPIIDDFAFETKCGFEKGENNGGFGVVFRLQDENNFYAFYITNTGYYKVAKRLKGEYTDLVTWTKHNAVNIGSPNLLKVEAIGTRFSFVINKMKVKEISDTAFRDGKFGLYAFKNVQAGFDEIIVYQGELIFYDYFGAPTENWIEGEAAYIRNGMYVVDGLKLQQDYYTWNSDVYQNISLKTEVAWMAGATDTSFGIVFHFVDINNHYLFTITKNGYYRFGYYKDNVWKAIVDWKRSRLLNTDGKNILRVECIGDTYALYLNDNLVETINDATFKRGKIGFTAAKGVSAAFDNVELFALE